MLHPNSGMSATMRDITTRNWGLASILTGIIKKPHTKMTYGISRCLHRQHRRSASFWTNHGNHSIGFKRQEG